MCMVYVHSYKTELAETLSRCRIELAMMRITSRPVKCEFELMYYASFSFSLIDGSAVIVNDKQKSIYSWLLQCLTSLGVD